MAVDARELATELAGLDRLELDGASRRSALATFWSATWPKAAALILAVAAWQVVFWTHWRPSYVLPGPGAVFRSLWHDAGTALFWRSIGFTLRRGLIGYGLAVVIGLAVGSVVARFQLVRSAVGSLITGLQTMPSVTWFPLALLLFKLSEGAITFVVVVGAAPSIANGMVSGVDHVPPLLLRSGRMLGAGGLRLWRHVVFPASLPSLVTGLKQGWAFAWRSLMAGELLVIIAHRPSIGQALEQAQTLNDSVTLLEYMIVVLVIGIGVDAVFAAADRSLRRRWGLMAG